MVEYKIAKEKIEKLLGYLAAKPWIESNELIAMLSKLEKIDSTEPTVEEKTPPIAK